MGTVAASGGYYIAVATDRIMANPGTLTGSIGVIMEMANVEGLLKKIGVEGVVIKSGRFKDVGSPLRKMSDEEHKLLQSVMDDVHQQFIQAVADGRVSSCRMCKPWRTVEFSRAVRPRSAACGRIGRPRRCDPARGRYGRHRRRAESRGAAPTIFDHGILIESRWSSVFPKLELDPASN